MKKTVAVIFGGSSSEHEVSCVSGANIADGIDRDLYDIILIGITKDGRWLFTDSTESIKDGSWQDKGVKAYISPDSSEQCVIIDEGGALRRQHIDVVFPALHGLYGEDGTLQGLLELSRIPYVGCGVLAGATAMDKLATKIVADKLGIAQAAYVHFFKEDFEADPEAVMDEVETLGYPVFIKPANEGSSCGISKASDRAGLKSGIEEACRHDRKIVVEEMIVGREVESAVLGAKQARGGIRVSGIGEVLAAADFYDYDAKYNNPQSETVIDPDVPEETVEEIRRDAAAVFEALDCFGLARVDFFIRNDGRVIFNEINTLPGFTGISMYPMLWKARGINLKELTTTLIEMAYER